jgi:hypothetical protein
MSNWGCADSGTDAEPLVRCLSRHQFPVMLEDDRR